MPAWAMGDRLMNRNSLCKALAAVTFTLLLIITAAPKGECQAAAAILKDPKTGNIQLKALTSKDLKDAVAHAVTQGDMDPRDGKALIEKITDIETLMDQFDFIRDQQRRLVSGRGVLFH